MCKSLAVLADRRPQPAIDARRHARRNATSRHRRRPPGAGGLTTRPLGGMVGLVGARRTGLSLHARLLVMVALSAALVVGGVTALQRRIVVAAVEDEAVEAAGATALGVAAEITEHDGLPTDADLDEMLADFQRMVPAVRGLTVVRLDEQGRLATAASTEHPPPAVAALSRRALETRERAVSDLRDGPARFVAVPLERDHRPYGAVVVSISRDAVQRVRDQVRTAALVFTPLAIVVLVALLHALARDLVLAPVGEILGTMQRAAAGDLDARAPIRRPDEMGAVAAGLNAMLGRVADFNAALKVEVERATAELRETNQKLAESAQRLFAARRDLTRSEQLATAGRMAASVAHQIGTPLNLISGYVQMIQAEMPPLSPSSTRLRTVQEQIGRVTTIVQGLLDQARRPALERQEIAPGDLVAGVCELARPSLEAAGVTLHVSVPVPLPHLDVDVGQLEQVLLNLITNSIDAMPGGGELRVTAEAADGQVEIAVADTGTGIAPEHVGRVFDPLFTTKARGKGTGLGLAIAREVVAAHGGTITVSSGPGNGTTVRVRLPAVATAAEPRHA
jgi:signal transduction histidine kinase